MIVVKVGGAVVGLRARRARGRRRRARRRPADHRGDGPAGLEVALVGGRRVTDARAILVVREALLDVNRSSAHDRPARVGLVGDEIGLRATPVPELGEVGTPLPVRAARRCSMPWPTG